MFNKKDLSQDRGRYGYNRSSGFGGLYDNRESKFTYGDDFSNPDVMAGSVPSRQKQQELEDLLVRADDQNICKIIIMMCVQCDTWCCIQTTNK